MGVKTRLASLLGAESFAEPALPDALKRCRRAAADAHARSEDTIRAAEAVLELLEVEVQGAVSSASGWVDGASETIRPVTQLQERVAAITADLRIDMRALLLGLRERTDPFRIALFGRTKAGKSTLYAALSQEPGAELHIGKGGDRTTKDIRTYPAGGMTFVDVPGICAFGQEGRFDEQLARTVVEPSDVILFLVTNDGVSEDELKALHQLRLFNKPLVLVHNLKLDLEDPLYLRRAKAGKDGTFDHRTLGEHMRRVERYFRERGVAGPDHIIPIHADAAFKATRAEDHELAEWFRGYSRIIDLERALIDYAVNRGAFIRARTYSEPLVRYLADSVSQLEREAFGLWRHRRFVIEQKKRLLGLMEQLERDSLGRLAGIREIFTSLEAEIDDLIEHEPGESLASAWAGKLNGPVIGSALEALARKIGVETAAALVELQHESDYDAQAWARDIAVECDVTEPVLGNAGRWWRRGGAAFAAVAGVAAVLTGGVGGVVVGILALLRVGPGFENLDRFDRLENSA